MSAKKAPNATDKHVGARIRMRRMMLGMSQEKLADGIGLTFQQVQKYEKGTNRIGASRLQQIANILRSPVAFFFDGAPGGAALAQGTDLTGAPDLVGQFFSLPYAAVLAKAYIAIEHNVDRNTVVLVARAIARSTDKERDAA